ncbi:uncharacterized protein N7458_009680 [Penicillium daleae]|uniref:Uncharacterized protein n=1 Tax=Penicillium daleae TaxID=63821 RepID=A0AAD6BZ43_9EURO|nr:uncharacterized protein N7458_009680 [Penicillium daleae]KAJ5438682.1 hypothetical protein N7458_009680 [Penicillium daleae]
MQHTVRERPHDFIETGDASEEGSFKRVERKLPDEVDNIRNRRFQIVNVQPDDMVELDLIWPGYLGENLFLYFNPDYKLYFLDKQTRDEVLIFKQFDSKDGVAKNCLQGSFPDPRKGPSDNARVGFDVAVLMIYQVVLVALC